MAEDAGHDIGSIVGYLKLDLADFLANIDRADRAANDLGRVSPTIRVRVDDTSAIASLQAVKAQADRVSDSNVKIQKTAQDAAGDQGLGLIAQAAIALGPALGPLVGAAAAGAGAFAFLGAAGALAFKGIQVQEDNATVSGSIFNDKVTDLTALLQRLESTAAGAALVPFSNTVDALSGEFPTLNGGIAYFAQKAGEIAEHVVPGMLTGFNTLTPLFQFVAQGLEHGAEKFEAWSQSTGGIVKFASYAQMVLPTVVGTVSEVVQAIVHLGAAFSTTGTTALGMLRLTADAINALPLPVLQGLAIAVESGYGAWKLYQGLTWVTGFFEKTTARVNANREATARNSAAIAANGVATTDHAAAATADAAAQARLALAENEAQQATAKQAAMLGLAGQASADYSTATIAAMVAAERLAVAEAEASGTSAELTAAQARLTAAQTEAAAASRAAGEASLLSLGPIGAIAGIAAVGLAAFGIANASSAEHAQEDAAAVQSLTSALEQSNGAINDSIRDMAKKTLVDDGAFKAADTLGISLSDVTDAALGQKDALDRVTSAAKDMQVAGIEQVGTLTDLQDSNGKLTAAQQKQYETALSQRDAAKLLLAILSGQTGVIATAIQNQKDYAAAGSAAASASAGLASASSVEAARLGVTADAYDAASVAAGSAASSTAQTTLKMQLENDAAGLLKQALDTLNGKTLDVASAQTQLSQQTLTATETLKKNKGTIDQKTQAGIDDAQAVQGQVRAIQALDQANIAAGMSQTDATNQARAQAAQFLAGIANADGAKSAIYAYAQQLLQIPTPPPTVLEVDTAIAQAQVAAFKNWIAGLTTTIDVQAVTGYSNIAKSGSMYQYAMGGIAGFAAGGIPSGLVQGAGTGTSDSILARLSKGEFVVPAKQTAMYLPILETLRTTGQMPTIQGPSPSSPAAQAVRVAPSSSTGRSAATDRTSNAAVVAEMRALRAEFSRVMDHHAEVVNAGAASAARENARMLNMKQEAGTRRS